MNLVNEYCSLSIGSGFLATSEQRQILDMQKFYQELFKRAARQKQLLSQLLAAWAPAGEGGRWGPTVLRHKVLLWRHPDLLLSCINFCFFYFKDVNAKQRKMNKFLERLKLLETYSQELLKTDAKISQSEDLIQFFRAQTQDLDPCFPEDRYKIIFFGCLFVHLFKKQKCYRIWIEEKHKLGFWVAEQGCSTESFNAYVGFDA